MPLRDRHAAVRFLAATRFGRLVAVARAAGGGDHSEDAVQDVLERLAAGAGAPPRDAERLLVYASVAVRRRARELARAEGPAPAAVVRPPHEPAADERHEARRALGAYRNALADLPPRAAAMLTLDAAGWSRIAIASRVDASERAVKRVLDTHRTAVLAATARALDGSDCAHLGPTLAAYAAGAGAPRADGPVARHLAVCDACRSGLAAARRTRTALRALLPLPFLPPLGHTSHAAPATAARHGLAALAKPALVIVACVGAGTAATVIATRHPHDAPPPAAQPALQLPLPAVVVVARVRLQAGGLAARVGLASSRAGRLAALHVVPPRRARDVPSPAPARPSGCGYGTLRDCSTDAALGSLG